MLLTRDSLQSYVSLDTETVSKGMKKTFHENENDETVRGGNTHIRQNKESKIQSITKDTEEHYRVLKGSIQKEDIPLVNIYAPGC